MGILRSMKKAFKVIVGLGAILLVGSCASSSLVPVTDANERAAIEQKWIHNYSMKLTTYYPSQKVMSIAKNVIAEKNIAESEVSEMFYHSTSDGRHVLFIETDERDESVRYHCLGLTKEDDLAVFWVQFQESGKKMQIESVSKPRN